MIFSPDFFIAGAAKSGTSSLHQYLDQHHAICMSEIKEPHYYTHDDKYCRDEWYKGLFHRSNETQLCGESSTGYMVFDKFIERIKKERKNTKFIFVLRNPIDRAYSHYSWLQSLGYENRTFFEALYDKKELPIDVKNQYGGNYKYYLQYGFYGYLLSRFFDNFDRKDIKIITTESLKKNRLQVVNECFTFLGVESLPVVEEVTANATIATSNSKQLYRLRHLLNQDSILKKISKRIIPGKIREKISELIIELLQNKGKIKKNELSAAEREEIYLLYREDVKMLKYLTGMSFETWKDFVND